MKTIKDFARRVDEAELLTDKLVFVLVAGMILTFINHIRGAGQAGFLPYLVSSVAVVFSLVKWQYYSSVLTELRLKKMFSHSKIDSLLFFKKRIDKKKKGVKLSYEKRAEDYS